MAYDEAAVARAREFVAGIRASTVCERCGRQPIEWHNDEHIEFPYRRVAHLVALGFPIARIEAEIEASEALCRSCHMAVDGRAAALTAARPFKLGVKQPPKPCSECGAPTNPLRRGRCRRCYKLAARAGAFPGVAGG